MSNVIRTPDVTDAVHEARVREIEAIRAGKVMKTAESVGEIAVNAIVPTPDEAAWLKWRDIDL